MAIFRKIHTSFWSDTFIQDLDNDQRLFYLYLLTNERTKQCGIYEISKKQMAFDLGYSIDRVSKLLKYFISTGKVLYNETTKEIAIKNWVKYNSSTSPKVLSCIKSELDDVKDRVLIEYIKGIHTPSQEEQEQEKEEEEEQDQELGLVRDEIFDQVWKAYSQVSTRQPGSKKDAAAKFNKLKQTELEKIREHLPKYLKNHIAAQKTDYLPNFTTYLNQRRYEDEKLPYADSQNELDNWTL